MVHGIKKPSNLDLQMDFSVTCNIKPPENKARVRDIFSFLIMELRDGS